jgi:hypothetical protein
LWFIDFLQQSRVLCPHTIEIPPKSILDIGVIPLQSGYFLVGGPDIPVKSCGSGKIGASPVR